MVRYVKLLFPYVQLSFIGWVVWTAEVPQWQTVAVLLLLAWIALGITAIRVALAAVARAYVAQTDTTKLLRSMLPVTKPRHGARLW